MGGFRLDHTGRGQSMRKWIDSDILIVQWMGTRSASTVVKKMLFSGQEYSAGCWQITLSNLSLSCDSHAFDKDVWCWFKSWPSSWWTLHGGKWTLHGGKCTLHGGKWMLNIYFGSQRCGYKTMAAFFHCSSAIVVICYSQGKVKFTAGGCFRKLLSSHSIFLFLSLAWRNMSSVDKCAKPR